MISATKFFGGAVEVAMAADYQMKPYKRCWKVSASSAGLNLQLPLARDFPWMQPGGPWFYIWNSGATHNINLRVTTGVVGVIAPGKVFEVWMRHNIANGDWLVWNRTKL